MTGTPPAGQPPPPVPPGRGSNWGRWGAADEKGALNLITDESVAAAAAIVRRGRRYSLALTLDFRRLPASPSRVGAAHFMTLDAGDYAAGLRLPHDARVADDYVVMPTQWGTHLDALAHVWRGEELYNGHPASSVRSFGASRCGIDKAGVIVTRGILLDVPAVKDVTRLPAGYQVESADIDAALERAGTEIRPGDAILLRTGWIQLVSEAPEQFYTSQPGLGLEAALGLARRDVCLIGADNAAVEAMSWQGRATTANNVVHQHLIRDFGIHLLEMMNLEELARDEVRECLLVIAPLPFHGGVGSPVVPVALC